MLIILMLFISGNVHPNPGTSVVIDNPTVLNLPISESPVMTTASNLTFENFCERTSLDFLHVNIRILMF